MGTNRPAPAELRGFARALWIAAVVLAGLFTVGASLFTAGYAMDDPGGLAGLGLIATWFVPLLIAIALAVKVPETAFRILAAIAVLAIAVGIWQLIDPMGLHEFENRYGPITAVGSFVTLLPLAIAARVRMWECALLMMAFGISLLLPELRLGMHLGSSGAVAMPALLIASLLGLCAALAPRR